MKPTVYGIGNPLIDLNYRVKDTDISALGLTKGIMHLLDDKQRETVLKALGSEPLAFAAGGDTPNVMVNLALLGTSSAFSGKVGDDDFGLRYETRLSECGVTSGLSFGKGTTGSSIIMVHPDGERTMGTYLGMCRAFEPKDVSRPFIMQSEALFFSGYLWDTPSQKDAIQLALSTARGVHHLIIFDAADPFAVNRYRDDFLMLLDQHVDIAFANADEARGLFGSDNLETCARSLAKIVPCGAVKLGAEGAWVFLNGELAKVPSFAVDKVVDTTGAGDSFAAGFIHGLLSRAKKPDGSFKSLHELTIDDAIFAGRTAAFVAAIIIGRTGPQLTIEEATIVRERLENGDGKAFTEAR